MANSYNALGLIIQVDGENSSTWGDYTNTNLNILASTAGGNNAVSFTSVTGVTITSVNGANDQGKNRVFLCTGVLTAPSTLTFPATEREYIVINQCTGAFTLTVTCTGATNSGVIVPQSVGGLMIYCDGANMQISIDLNALGGVSKSVPNVYTAQQNFGLVPLTYGATITWDVNVAQVASITFPTAATVSLSNPVNLQAGATYILFVYQPSGLGLITYGTAYNFGIAGVPTLSTGGTVYDILTFISDGTQMNYVGIAQGF